MDIRSANCVSADPGSSVNIFESPDATRAGFDDEGFVPGTAERLTKLELAGTKLVKPQISLNERKSVDLEFIVCEWRLEGCDQLERIHGGGSCAETDNGCEQQH